VDDNDISAISLYRDDGDGAFSASSDTLVTSGADKFIGGTATLDLNTPESMLVSPSYRDYFVTFSISPSATVGRTVGLTIASTGSVTVLTPDQVSAVNFPMTSGLTEITEYADTVYFTTASISPAGVNPGSSNVPILKLQMWTLAFGAPFTNLQFDRIGTLQYDRYKAVKLYRDNNGNGVFDAPDVFVASGTFPNSFTPVSLAIPPSYQTINASTRTFFVVADVSAAAELARTLGLRASAGSYMSIALPNTLDPNPAKFPFQSQTVLINEPASILTVSVSSISAVSVLQGAADAPFLRLDAAMDAYSGVWTALRVNRMGTGSDSDLSAIKIYKDDGDGLFSAVGDTLVSGGSDLFSGGSSNITFTSPQTITTSAVSYFVTGDISLVAVASTTVGIRVEDETALTVTSPDGASVLYSTRAGTSLISATVDTLQVTATALPVPGLMQGVEKAFEKLVMKADQNQVVWNNLVLQKLGTISDADISSIRVYKDTNNSGIFDVGDTLVTSGAQVFTNGQASLPIGGAMGEVITTGDTVYFVTLTFRSLASVGSTAGVSISTLSAVGVLAPDLVSGLVWQSSIGTVGDNPDTVMVSPSALISSASYVYQGTELGAARLNMSVNDDAASLVSVKVKKLGTILDADISSVRLYRDNGDGLFGAGDTLLTSGSNVFSGGETTLSLLSLQTLTAVETSLFVTYVLAPTAAVGSTVGLELTTSSWVSVSGVDVVSSSNMPFMTGLGVVLDGRTPTTPVVTDDGIYTRDLRELSFVWSSTVALGSIASIQYAVGTGTAGATNVVNWTSSTVTGTGRSMTLTLSLQNGTTYFVAVRAQSSSGYWSGIGYSDGIMPDAQLPSAPSAPQIAADGDTLIVNWNPPSSIGISGIAGYIVEERDLSKPVWKALAASEVVGASRFQSASAGGLSPSIPFGTVTGTAVTIKPAKPGTYVYRVSALSGSGVLSDPSGETRVNYALNQLDAANISNYPNPFDSRREQTTITYTLKSDANILVVIYDAFGGKVKELNFGAGSQGGAAGTNLVTWDGTDSDGSKVSQGVYYTFINAGDSSGLGSKRPLVIGVLH
jgi:hypothetical protein